MLRLPVMAGALLSVGCSITPRPDYGDLELIEVSGRVVLDGVPLNDAHVEFEDPDLTASSGRTNRMGEYRLIFNSEESGCLPGEKVVRISMRPSGDDEDPDAEPTSRITVPTRYNTQSELRANVSADQRRFDFDLTSVE